MQCDLDKFVYKQISKLFRAKNCSCNNSNKIEVLKTSRTLSSVILKNKICVSTHQIERAGNIDRPNKFV